VPGKAASAAGGQAGRPSLVRVSPGTGWRVRARRKLLGLSNVLPGWDRDKRDGHEGGPGEFLALGDHVRVIQGAGCPMAVR
jgi:hypothetical protein